MAKDKVSDGPFDVVRSARGININVTYRLLLFTHLLPLLSQLNLHLGHGAILEAVVLTTFIDERKVRTSGATDLAIVLNQIQLLNHAKANHGPASNVGIPDLQGSI